MFEAKFIVNSSIVKVDAIQVGDDLEAVCRYVNQGRPVSQFNANPNIPHVWTNAECIVVQGSTGRQVANKGDHVIIHADGELEVVDVNFDKRYSPA